MERSGIGIPPSGETGVERRGGNRFGAKRLGEFEGNAPQWKKAMIMACWATRKQPAIQAGCTCVWSQQGMILRLPDYESGALTN